jgi:dihydrofolate synthase/folylpolyglutamate synthase
LKSAGFAEDKEHSVRLHTDAASAWAAARDQASDNDRIVVFGSFVTVGNVMQVLDKQRQGLSQEPKR